MNIIKGIVKDIKRFTQSDLFDKIREDYPMYDLWWKKAMQRDCWYILSGDKLVAACIVKFEEKGNCDIVIAEDEVLKISLFIVSSRYRGLGLGRLLLTAVENFSTANNINNIYLSTKNKNEDAINFFIRKKFSIVKVEDDEAYLLKKDINNYFEINRDAYDALSYEYKLRGEVKSSYEETPAHLVSCVLDTLSLGKVYNVLEVGPGSGEILEEFEKRGHRTIAVEISSKIANYAKKRSPKSFFIHSNILDVNFLNYQFDIIYAGALIHLFNEKDANILLDKFNNWLTKDGKIFINTTISDITEEGFFDKKDYNSDVKRFRRKWKEDDFKKFVEKYFLVENTLYTNEVDRDKIWVAHICKKNI